METSLNVIATVLYLGIPAYFAYVLWRWHKIAKKIDKVIAEHTEEVSE